MMPGNQGRPPVDRIGNPEPAKPPSAARLLYHRWNWNGYNGSVLVGELRQSSARNCRLRSVGGKHSARFSYLTCIVLYRAFPLRVLTYPSAYNPLKVLYQPADPGQANHLTRGCRRNLMVRHRLVANALVRALLIPVHGESVQGRCRLAWWGRVRASRSAPCAIIGGRLV